MVWYQLITEVCDSIDVSENVSFNLIANIDGFEFGEWLSNHLVYVGGG